MLPDVSTEHAQVFVAQIRASLCSNREPKRNHLESAQNLLTC